MTTEKIVVALITSPVLTVLATELIRGIRRKFDKKKNKGFAKVETDIAYIQKQMKKVVADLDDSKETEKVLLHDRLWQIFRIFTEKEAVTVEDRANLEYMYSEYEKKGGNHEGKLLYELSCRVPVIPKEENDNGEN